MVEENANADTTADCPATKADLEQITLNTHYTQSLLAQLKPKIAKQFEAISTAQEALAFWEKNELDVVRKAFEE